MALEIAYLHLESQVPYHDEHVAYWQWFQQTFKTSYTMPPAAKGETMSKEIEKKLPVGQPRIVRLLPCPFCGAKAKLNRYQHDRTRVYYACSMPRCSYTYADEQNAAKAWNRRTTENALLAIDAQIEGSTQAASGDLLAALGSEFAINSTMVARHKAYETLRLRGYDHEESIAAAKQIIHCG